MLLYKSDPSTGQVFETQEVDPTEVDDYIKKGWFETPRWQRNPRPHGLSNDNPYERHVPYTYQEYPRCLHKAGGQTLIVKNDHDKGIALKGGWSLDPVPLTPAEPAADDAPVTKGKKAKDQASA